MIRIGYILFLGLLIFSPWKFSEGTDSVRTVVLLSLMMLSISVSAEMFATFLVQRVWSEQRKHRQLVHIFRYVRGIHQILALLLFGATLLLSDWMELVSQEWRIPSIFGLQALVIIAPLALAMISSWFSFYRVERAFFETWASHADGNFWSLWAYVKQMCAEHLADLMEPWYFLSVLHLAWRFSGPIHQKVILLLGMLALGWLVLPWVWRLLWPAFSLPKGPLRDQIMRLADTSGVHCSDILIWDTRGTQTLAMLVGVASCSRFLVLSDRLLDRLCNTELMLIIGHELGHVARKHYALKLSTVSIFTLGFALGGPYLFPWLQSELSSLLSLLILSLSILLAGVLVHLGFGSLSRLCERDADHFAIESLRQITSKEEADLIRAYEAALAKVNYYNGETIDSYSWTHGTVRQRLHYLQSMGMLPQMKRHLKMELNGIWLSLAASYGLMIGVLVALPGSHSQAVSGTERTMMKLFGSKVVMKPGMQ